MRFQGNRRDFCLNPRFSKAVLVESQRSQASISKGWAKLYYDPAKLHPTATEHAGR